jgi:type IV secretion system protein VirD4
MNTKAKTLITCVIVAVASVALFYADPAWAQNWNRQSYNYGPSTAYLFGMAILRVILIVGLGGLGFAIGWFLSPHARGARKVVLLVIAAVVGLIILFSNGTLSWGLAWLAGYVLFLAGLGYWAQHVVKSLGATPTTFGSAKWADADHLKAHKVFDPKPEVSKAQEPHLAAKSDLLGHTSSEAGALYATAFPSSLAQKGQNPFSKSAMLGGQYAAAPLSNIPKPVPKPKPGIRLGLAFDGDSDANFYYRGDRHLITVAPTRSGKGTTQIIPNLLTYEGSALVIDPKGENARITSEARKKMGHRVLIVDPWGIAVSGDQQAAKFNPLEWLKLGDVDITENAMLLADALIVQTDHKEAFWTEEAKALLQGVILYVATDPGEVGHRHLARVRDLMLLDGDQLKELFNAMLNSPHHVVASTGARCLQKEERLLANVLASAQAQTHFLDSTRMRESLSTSDFDFADLKTKQMTIYLVLPSDRLNAFSRWMRLLVQQAITMNARNIEVKPKQPVLFLLDEMPTLGRLAMVELAYGLMAGFGMQLWGIVQDLGQLKRIYGDGWETFIGNSGVIQYFGSHDSMTANYFSDLCGVTTVWNLSSAISTAFGTSSGQGGASSSHTVTESDTRAAAQRKLIYPDELMRMHSSKQLVFIENMNPILAKRVPWFEESRLKAKGQNLHKA